MKKRKLRQHAAGLEQLARTRPSLTSARVRLAPPVLLALEDPSANTLSVFLTP